MRTVTLTERRPVTCRLPRADAAELARSFHHVVDVRPTFDRGVYRVVARGHVGFFQTAGVRWVVRPKLPWDGFAWLTGGAVGTGRVADVADWPGAVVSLLADRLAALIRERAAAGLFREYAERETESGTVRGRIDFARQSRDPLRAADRFHLVADEFTPDVVWNRAPKAAARLLLASDKLTSASRDHLTAVLLDLAGIGDDPVVVADIDRLVFDARTAAYRPVVELSRQILAGAAGHGSDGLLVNLERLFETYVTDGLIRHAGRRGRWSVSPQELVPLRPDTGAADPLPLRPDIVVHGSSGEPVAVWDVKWKEIGPSGPTADDIHQVLGYATVLGVQTAGLVYPGRRFALSTWRADGGRVALHAVRLRLTGLIGLRERAVERFARLVGRAGRNVP